MTQEHLFVLYKFFGQFCRAVGVEVVGVEIYRQAVYGFVCPQNGG